MADKRIDRINFEVHSPGTEIQPRLLAELLLDAIEPLLFEPDTPVRSGSQNSRAVAEPTPRTSAPR